MVGWGGGALGGLWNLERNLRLCTLLSSVCSEGIVLNTRKGIALRSEGLVLTREGSVLIRDGSVLIRKSSVLIRKGSVPIRKGSVLRREGESPGCARRLTPRVHGCRLLDLPSSHNVFYLFF